MTIGWSMGQLIVDEGATSAIDYCTLADVEAYTGVDFSEGIGATDAQIALMISNASRLVDAYAGTQVAGTVGVTEYFDINGWTKHLVMGIRPVTSITNIYTIDSAGIETALVQGRVRNTDEYWLHDSDAGIVRFMGKFSQDGVLALKAVYFAGNATPTIEAKMATIMMVARNAARSALNDENCMDRVKEMWARLLKSSESDMKEMLELVKRHSTIAVATFGMDGNY
tara:strand:+ start:5888 stop:6565 length:678 start_codon:yes stop_codon:yes gene_type:complete